MFDTSQVLFNGRYLWVCRYCSRDFYRETPLSERLNPLRIEIGIRTDPSSGPRWCINRRGRLAIKWANFVFRLRAKLGGR